MLCHTCGTEFQRSRPEANRMNWCSLPCRLWSRVDRSAGPDGCWPWTGKARSDRGTGYGLLNVEGKLVGAHRVAFAAANGPIPDGLYVCHTCDNKLCCNPAHHFLGTHGDNMRDRTAKGFNVITPEGCARIAASKVGKPRSPETVRRMVENKRSARLKRVGLILDQAGV